MILTNKYQTELTDELLESLHPEVKDDLLDAIENIEFVKRLISPTRKYAKDLKKDSSGKIIVDVCNPHILEDMDYFRPIAKHFQQYGTLTNLRPNANPNSEFGKWLRREVDRIWDGMVRESDGEWVTGQMYYYLNYMPIIQTRVYKGEYGQILSDRITDFPLVWEGVYLWFHYLYQARFGGIYNDFKGGQHGVQIAKRGAPHPYSSKVLTTNGIKSWGDIKIGDFVYGKDGVATEVINEIPQGTIPIYKITLKDGRVTYGGEDHIWEVYKSTNKQYKQRSLLTTKELLNSYYNNRTIKNKCTKDKEFKYSIGKIDCLQFNKQDVKIDPYTFGLLLGDGCFRLPSHKNKIHYTSTPEDIEVYRQYVPYNIEKRSPKYSYSFSINNVIEYLKETGLHMCKSENKFIPSEYLYNTEEVRMNLLKGLMDSDGTVSKTCYVFSTSSEKLQEDFLFLVRSLGMNASSKKRKSVFNGKNYKDHYQISVYTDKIIFNLPRKIDKLKNKISKIQRSKIDFTTIVDVSYSHDEEAKCITVDAKDSLYLIDEFIPTHNSKSYVIASILARLFVAGDNSRAYKKTKGLVLAHDKEKLTKDGTLNKFVDAIDFASSYTQFPSIRLKSTLDDMHWIMGYKDAITGTNRGTLNETLGMAVNDKPGKGRGKRLNILTYEEFGAFPKFIDTWNTNKRSVQEGNVAFGQAIAIGTGGEEGSNFSGALEIIYSPKAYNVYALPNIFDKGSQGKQLTIFFFGAYLNRALHYDSNGVSDVIGALIEIFNERVDIKYSASDPMTLTRTKAEDPITIQEAIMTRESTIYPVSDLTEQLHYIDQNPEITNEILSGELILKDSKVEFKPSYENPPIREFPLKDNKATGCIEIHKMPEVGSDGRPYPGRYIAGIDPYDDDVSTTLSLGSMFVLDLVTDKIVAEYTGRPMYAEQFYENCRRLAMYYNATINYENNKKGLFAYFSKTYSLHLLTDTLEFLKDKDPIGNKAYLNNKTKGTIASQYTKQYYRRCIRDWLLKPDVKHLYNESPDGVIDEYTETSFMLKTINSRALLKELCQWNPDGNYDRHDALGMLMLLREDRLRMLGDRSVNSLTGKDKEQYLGDDPFFSKNFRGTTPTPIVEESGRKIHKTDFYQ